MLQILHKLQEYNKKKNPLAINQTPGLPSKHHRVPKFLIMISKITMNATCEGERRGVN